MSCLHNPQPFSVLRGVVVSSSHSAAHALQKEAEPLSVTRSSTNDMFKCFEQRHSGLYFSVR